MQNSMTSVPESGDRPRVSPEYQIFINQVVSRLHDEIRAVIREEIPHDHAPENHLSKKDAAVYLGIKPSTLSKWITEGCAPKYSKMGSRVIFRREWLDEHVEKNATSSN